MPAFWGAYSWLCLYLHRASQVSVSLHLLSIDDIYAHRLWVWPWPPEVMEPCPQSWYHWGVGGWNGTMQPSPGSVSCSCPLAQHWCTPVYVSSANLWAWEHSELYLDSRVQGEWGLSRDDCHPYLLLPRNHVWFHELLWDLELSHHCSQQQVCGVVVWLTGLVSSFKRITRLKSVRTVLMSVVSRVLKLGYDL